MELPLKGKLRQIIAAAIVVAPFVAGAGLSALPGSTPDSQPSPQLRVSRIPMLLERVAPIYGQACLLEIQGEIDDLALHLVQTEAACEDCQQAGCVQKVEDLCERLRDVRAASDRMDSQLAAVDLSVLQNTLAEMWSKSLTVEAVQGVCERRARGYVHMSSRSANRCEADIVLELNR